MPSSEFSQPTVLDDTSGKASSESAVPESEAQLSRIAITRFLLQTGIVTRGLCSNPDSAVEGAVREEVSTWDLCGIDQRLFDAAVFHGLRIATLAYGHIVAPAQIYVALLSTLSICIDDPQFPHAALDEFSDRLYDSTPQLHPLLDRLVDLIHETGKHYPAYASKAIIKSIVEFVDSCGLESKIAKMPLVPGSLSYVTSKRLQNGIGRAYSFLVWDKIKFPDVCVYLQAIPELEKHIDFVNDIFSFYKEELAGERGNYVSERALVTGQSISTALLDIVDDTVNSTVIVRRILEGTPAGEACEAAMAGYTAWHCLMSRYRLKELFDSNHTLPVDF